MIYVVHCIFVTRRRQPVRGVAVKCMRRKNEQEASGNGAGHIKFRVVEFEIDGGNDMLAEGIKALTTALSKSSVTTTVVSQRTLPSVATKHTTTTAVPDVEPPAEPEGET